MSDSEPIIEVAGLSFGYAGQPPVFDQLDFTLRRGDRIGLVAPNGSGKTTLFHLIIGLLKPQAGVIRFLGRPLGAERDFVTMRRQVGLLFQDADDQLFSPTVLEDVAFGPLNLGQTQAQAVDRAKRTLSFLGLEGYESRLTHKLSGGEKRLVALATILAMEPQVLLLDEPSSGLDEATKQTLQKVLGSLDLSYVIISHEADFVDATTDRLLTLKNGKISDHIYRHIHWHVHTDDRDHADGHPHHHHHP